jgi:hypothetical protein
VRRVAEFRHGCDDLMEATAPGLVSEPGLMAKSGRFARRPLLRAAVFGSRERDRVPVGPTASTQVVIGQVLDVSPHVIVVQTDAGEDRLPMLPGTTAWRGGPVPPAALHHGDHAIIRKAAARAPVAERIWAQIGRVTGTIIEVDGPELLVDEGPAKGRKIVLIDEPCYQQILVRFPKLDPGYLLDVIGLRQQGFLQALYPATSQPPYRADHPPTPPLISGHVPDPVSGTAVWHEPGEEPDNLLGVAYPALDPETGCERARPAEAAGAAPAERHAVDPHGAGPGCVRLPYLSVGSSVRIRNECTGLTGMLPVTSCGASARLFCDRCVDCGTSPKGRVADLTIAAFVQLGGDLEKGCFNATMTTAS